MKFLELTKTALFVFLFLVIAIISFSSETNAQDRKRVVEPKTENQTNPQTQSTRPTTRIPSAPNSRKTTLTNDIVVKKETPQELVRKTSQSSAIRTEKKESKKEEIAVNRGYYSATTRSMMMRSIQNKIGIRYRLGTQGPNLYDCSGFVWKVFQESGFSFTRTSARQYWRTFEPVSGDERFQFGTLVFLNRLGHMGIVADENGFYHASSSQGITYSKFEGYWGKRIVGFRRVPANYGMYQTLDKDESEEK